MLCRAISRKHPAEDPQVHAFFFTVGTGFLRPALFRYTGRTRMIAVGEGTRTMYCFNCPGATAIIDGRDVASLARLPMLVRV